MKAVISFQLFFQRFILTKIFFFYEKRSYRKKIQIEERSAKDFIVQLSVLKILKRISDF